MMNKFFYLKLGKGNCLAEYWLKVPNVVDGSAAAIYFGKITAKQIVELSKLSDEKKAKEQFKQLTGNQDFKAVKDFITAGNNAEKTKFVTITSSKVYIFEPESQVSDLSINKYKRYDRDLDELSERGGIDAQTKRNVKEGKIAKYLFSVPMEFEKDLKGDAISDDLRSKFKKKGEALSKSAPLKKVDDGWEIADEEKTYHIRRENKKLKIYALRHPKFRFIKNFEEYKIAEVPHVLATLPCNQYYTQGTCREIKEEKYLFSWSKDFANNGQELKEFLMEDVDGNLKKADLKKADWKEAVKQPNDDKIVVSVDTNSIELTLDKKRDKVNLKIDNSHTYDFPVKKEGSELKIYKKENFGVFQAINYLQSGKKMEVPKDKLIELLSPYEIETLVFLILKNADPNLFVPAWRGGTQKGIDIIAHNLANKQIEIPPVVFKPNGSRTFQVKRKVKEHIKVANCTVAAEYYGNNPHVLDAKWLLEQIKSEKQQETRKWLINSLVWIKDIKMLIENTKAL